MIGPLSRTVGGGIETVRGGKNNKTISSVFLNSDTYNQLTIEQAKCEVFKHIIKAPPLFLYLHVLKVQ
jgi:hypothetical protein